VRQGIGQRRPAGALRFASTVRGDHLELEVRDDGPGLPAGFRIGMNGGVGLRNTEARLAAAYGAAWSFDLATQPDGGTVACVRIPAST
jgi:sensor histidine kinase YesM